MRIKSVGVNLFDMLHIGHFGKIINIEKDVDLLNNLITG